MKENAGAIMALLFLGVPLVFGLAVLLREVQAALRRRRFERIADPTPAHPRRPGPPTVE